MTIIVLHVGVIVVGINVFMYPNLCVYLFPTSTLTLIFKTDAIF